MTQRELGDAVEIIPHRLYWVALHSKPSSNGKVHYFSIDEDLVYEPFFADFGPLNLACVYRYCKHLASKLVQPTLAHRIIVHYCAQDAHRRANAAFLMCAYQVIAMGRSADKAFEPFRGLYPLFLPFRDALCGATTFDLSILDCLEGLEKSIQLQWFDWTRFDVDSYDFFGRVENGDMNWIVPDKFLAFAGPCPTCTDPDGFPAFTPEDFVPIFREAGLTLVVRLNKRQYDQRRFIDHGIKHVDLYFRDGSCPSRDIITRFLHITEAEPGAVAVHCKAGLGRTGTLIGLYAMKHFRFPARAFIGWCRICRPGSILGPQQQFLVAMEEEMFQAGVALHAGSQTSFPLRHQPGDTHTLSQRMQALSVKKCPPEESYEDVGQGERLCSAKRKVKAGPPQAPVLIPGVTRKSTSNGREAETHTAEAKSASRDCDTPGGRGHRVPVQDAAKRSVPGMVRNSLQGLRTALRGSQTSSGSEASPR